MDLETCFICDAWPLISAFARTQLKVTFSMLFVIQFFVAVFILVLNLTATRKMIWEFNDAVEKFGECHWDICLTKNMRSQFRRRAFSFPGARIFLRSVCERSHPDHVSPCKCVVRNLSADTCLQFCNTSIGDDPSQPLSHPHHPTLVLFAIEPPNFGSHYTSHKASGRFHNVSSTTSIH